MCTASTAKRGRRNAKMDKRYRPKHSNAKRREFAEAKARAQGRSFGYSKK